MHPNKTLEEFVEYAKKNPHTVINGCKQVSGVSYLCLELFKLRAGGLQIDRVPYNTLG